jgi:hypothetical protein
MIHPRPYMQRLELLNNNCMRVTFGQSVRAQVDSIAQLLNWRLSVTQLDLAAQRAWSQLDITFRLSTVVSSDYPPYAIFSEQDLGCEPQPRQLTRAMAEAVLPESKSESPAS